MKKIWDQLSIQQQIDDGIEESLGLEYKSALALERNNNKKIEITKDVSAFANSAGGILFYGVAEYNDQSKKHLPERIDPIDRNLFSKEWLQDVINNIKPRIDGLIIHPVDIGTGNTGVVYVVDVPQSDTAHQALDFRYYKRYNFQSVPMEDFEIRDIMNRATTPDAIVEFGFQSIHTGSDLHTYRLDVLLKNRGIQAINKLKLEFTFPGVFAGSLKHASSPLHSGDFRVRTLPNGEYLITFRSKDVLFPEDELDIGKEMYLRYDMNDNRYSQIERSLQSGEEISLRWILYADNMSPRKGKKPIEELHNY